MADIRKRQPRPFDPKRGLRTYSADTVEALNERLKKLTMYQAGTYALLDIVEKELNEVLRARFIGDALKFVDGFDRYFKNIRTVPGEYLIPVFRYYERWPVGSKKDRFRGLYQAMENTGYQKQERVKSYIDCLYRSCINQVKRDLGMFDRHNTVSRHVADRKEEGDGSN